MRLLFTGVGDAFTLQGFGTSAIVEAPRGVIQIDCPDLALRALHEASTASGWALTPRDVDDVLLTHLHGDHCNGLEALAFWRRLAGCPRPRLHAIEPVLDRLWERLAPAMDAPFGSAGSGTDRPATLDDWFDVRPIDPDGVVDVAGLAVACRRTRHPIPTAALRFTAPGDDAPGLAWSSDTPDDADLRAWLGAARSIVHESNCGPAHTPLEALEAMPSGWRERTWVVHLPDGSEVGRGLRPARAGEIVNW